jgi:hypothetical protein
VTAAVETVKLADDAPAGTVTLVGSEVTEELSEMATDAPPEGPALGKLMVHVLGSRPATAVGEQVSDKTPGATAAGWTINELVSEAPL